MQIDSNVLSSLYTNTLKLQGAPAPAVDQSAPAAATGPLHGLDSFLPTHGSSIRDIIAELLRLLCGGYQGPTLSMRDRNVAGSLHRTLTRPYNDFILNTPYVPNATVRQGYDGIYRGPQGQPLIPVKLDDGKLAYVDPNTNQYYLSRGQRDCFGNVRCKGPLPLPANARFSNSHFSDADVRQLTRDARNHFHFPWFPPVVPPPRPLPIDIRPLPIDVRPLPVEVRPPVRFTGGAIPA